MTRSVPADAGSCFGATKRVSLNADVLDRILPFGFTLARAKSVHLRPFMSQMSYLKNRHQILPKSTWLPWASHVALVIKNVTANAEDVRDAGLIPGSGRSPGERILPGEFLPRESHGQRSLTDYSAGVSKSWTRLSN